VCFAPYDLFIVTAAMLDEWRDYWHNFKSIQTKDNSGQFLLKLAEWFKR
jgi:hypothetical protein